MSEAISIEHWNHWLTYFKVRELKQSSPEVFTPANCDSFESLHELSLPESYRNFCCTFGTCAFFNGLRVYCPNQELTTDIIYSTKEDWKYYSRQRTHSVVSGSMLETIESMLFGKGLVFAEGRAAKMYIFDLNTYREEDKTCDIWSASAEGALDSFEHLGRSFHELFLSFCTELTTGKADTPSLLSALPPEKRTLIKFHSENPIGVF